MIEPGMCPICDRPLAETVVTECRFVGLGRFNIETGYPNANGRMRLGRGTHLHGLVITRPEDPRD